MPAAAVDSPIRPFAHSLRTPATVIRRLIDILASLTGLLLLSPLFALIALLIKRDSPGPVFYWGARAGLHGRVFKILKFRTMAEQPKDDNGPPVTGAGDARITRIGRVLRETKANELPQLWNVLKGEMSLVGPRPEDPDIAATWPPDARAEILSIRPGITSPASILYRDEEKLLTGPDPLQSYLQDILPSKIRLDRLYVRHRTLLTDLDVLFWTLVVLIPPIRAREIDAYRVLSGPLARFISRDLRWFLFDFPVALASFVVAGLLWPDRITLQVGWWTAAVVALAIAMAFSLFNRLAGLNRVYWSRTRAREAVDLLAASGIVTVGLLVANPIVLPTPLPWGLLVVTGLLCTAGFVGARYRGRILTGLAARWLRLRQGQIATGERVLIVGAGELGEFAVKLIREGDLARVFTIAGFVDDDPRVQDMRIEGHRVLGPTSDLLNLVRTHDAGLVLFAITNLPDAEAERILALCRRVPARIVLVPDILAVLRAFFSVDNLDRPVSVHVGDDPAETSRILDELDALAARGDMQALRKRIAGLKRELSGDGEN
ncbi:MAG TPA: sugar transferase [Anaerolineales bacterium]|nr:sugar transferase [Anaerolineales bacterium]